jgi:hypothetical protein
MEACRQPSRYIGTAENGKLRIEATFGYPPCLCYAERANFDTAKAATSQLRYQC